jgi:hypothetical protein
VPAAFTVLLILAIAGCGGFDSGGAEGPLTTVRRIRELSAQPDRRQSVKLRGTVTYVNTILQQAYLQDATGGVRVDEMGLNTGVAAGSEIELTGSVLAGAATPVVMSTAVYPPVPKVTSPLVETMEL